MSDPKPEPVRHRCIDCKRNLAVMGRNGEWKRCVICELEHRKRELRGEED